MKKFLMFLVAGTLVLSITGCKKEEKKGDDIKKDAKEVVEDAKKDVKDAAK